MPRDARAGGEQFQACLSLDTQAGTSALGSVTHGFRCRPTARTVTGLQAKV